MVATVFLAGGEFTHLPELLVLAETRLVHPHTAILTDVLQRTVQAVLPLVALTLAKHTLPITVRAVVYALDVPLQFHFHT